MSFEPITQTDRLLSIQTPLPPDTLLIDRFVAWEEISRPFRIEVDLLADATLGRDLDVHPEELIGKTMTITVRRRQGDRYFNGYVRRFAIVSRDARFVRYHAELVPWLSLLMLASDCQPFYQKTVTDIVLDVFEQHGFRFDSRGGRHGELAYGPGPPETPRQYTVQYRETDFNFVNRLLEEEGIGYYFEHDRERHWMVLANSHEGYRTNPGEPQQIRMDWEGRRSELEECVTRWESNMQLLSEMWTLRDYHHQVPNQDVEANAVGLGGPRTGHRLEFYDYPGGYSQVFWQSAPSGLRDEADRFVYRRMQEDEATQEINWGTSTCPTLCPGHKIKLIEDEPAMGPVQVSREWPLLVTSVQHAATQRPAYVSGHRPKIAYENTFTAIPAGTLYRSPRRTPKPVIQGPQTARVVGLPESTVPEINTRRGPAEIQIHFPWDRSQAPGVWARVIQPWAGKTWGQQWIPRDGDEVMVEFLEGDPDCPVVVGSVYNAVNQPPFELPQYQTQSGIRSRSVPEGSPQTFHMLRFDDKKDREQVFLRSQKRMDVRALGSYYDTCGGSRHTHVGGDSYCDYDLFVSGTHDLHIQSNCFEALDGVLNLSVKRDVVHDFQEDRATLVGGKAELNAKQIILEASQQISLKVGDNFILIDASGVTIHGTLVKINSGGWGVETGDPEIVEPLDAATADTGEPGYLERAAGAGGGPPSRNSRQLRSQHFVAPRREGEDPAIETVRSLLRDSARGRHALEVYDRYGIQPSFEPGTGSWWQESINTTNLDPEHTDEERALDLVHEMNHAEASHEGRAPDPHRLDREGYIDAGLEEETEGEVRETEARDELERSGHDMSGTNPGLSDEYHEAYNQGYQDAWNDNPNATDEELRAAGRRRGADRINQGMRDGEVVSSRPGPQGEEETTSQEYGRIWDQANPGEAQNQPPQDQDQDDGLFGESNRRRRDDLPDDGFSEIING